jgi:hypothetical protein
MKRLISSFAALGAVLLMAIPVQASGVANGHSALTLNCGAFGTVTVSVNNANGGNGQGGFGAAQVVGTTGTHGIPTAFMFSLFDLTTKTPIFSGTQVQGGGNSHPNQTTTDCTSTQTGTASQLGFTGPGLPPGVSPTDTLQVTIDVTVIIQN